MLYENECSSVCEREESEKENHEQINQNENLEFVLVAGHQIVYKQQTAAHCRTRSSIIRISGQRCLLSPRCAEHFAPEYAIAEQRRAAIVQRRLPLELNRRGRREAHDKRTARRSGHSYTSNMTYAQDLYTCSTCILYACIAVIIYQITIVMLDAKRKSTWEQRHTRDALNERRIRCPDEIANAVPDIMITIMMLTTVYCILF